MGLPLRLLSLCQAPILSPEDRLRPYWTGESTAITPSDPATGTLNLIAKKASVLVKLPNELIRFVTPSIEQFLRDDMARSLATGIDSRMIDGAASATAIKGLLNYDNVSTLIASTTGAEGDTFEPEDPGLMVAEVEDNDHDSSSFGYAMRPKLWYQILNKRSDAVSASDGKGSFIFSVNRDDIARGVPGSMLGHRVATSTNIPNDRTKGSASNLSLILAGDFSQWIIARAGVLEIAMSKEGDTPFQNDETWIRAISHIDAAPRHESAFVLIDTLLETL